MAAAAELRAPRVVGEQQISSVLSYPGLLQRLSLAFRENEIVSPPRHRHPLSSDATLLLMPAWPRSPSPHSSPFMGVKIVSVFPHRSPSISASYILSSSVTGLPLAFLDGSCLTLWRTSAVSALASDLLSNRDSRVFLMVGSGALAPFLIHAHRSARPSISQILIWNRTHSRAEALASFLQANLANASPHISVYVCSDLEQAARSADLISCATMSKEALIRGAWLKPGAHLDLVGSFSRDMRECDEVAIERADGAVIVDSDAALHEAGELASMENHVRGTLSELVSGKKPGRQSHLDITVFKSVGCALADLAAAQLVYEKICNIE